MEGEPKEDEKKCRGQPDWNFGHQYKQSDSIYQTLIISKISLMIRKVNEQTNKQTKNKQNFCYLGRGQLGTHRFKSIELFETYLKFTFMSNKCTQQLKQNRWHNQLHLLQKVLLNDLAFSHPSCIVGSIYDVVPAPGNLLITATLVLNYIYYQKLFTIILHV